MDNTKKVFDLEEYSVELTGPFKPGDLGQKIGYIKEWTDETGKRYRSPRSFHAEIKIDHPIEGGSMTIKILEGATGCHIEAVWFSPYSLKSFFDRIARFLFADFVFDNPLKPLRYEGYQTKLEEILYEGIGLHPKSVEHKERNENAMNSVASDLGWTDEEADLFQEALSFKLPAMSRETEGDELFDAKLRLEASINTLQIDFMRDDLDLTSLSGRMKSILDNAKILTENGTISK